MAQQGVEIAVQDLSEASEHTAAGRVMLAQEASQHCLILASCLLQERKTKAESTTNPIGNQAVKIAGRPMSLTQSWTQIYKNPLPEPVWSLSKHRDFQKKHLKNKAFLRTSPHLKMHLSDSKDPGSYRADNKSRTVPE